MIEESVFPRPFCQGVILPREKLFGRATVSRQNPHPARQGSACPEREAVRQRSFP